MKNEVREIKLDEINILCIIRDLLKNIWVILLAAAAGWLAAAGVMSLLYVPEFTAQATLAVSAKGDSSAYSSLSLTNQMAGVFSEVFDSNVLKEKIAEELGEDSIDETIQASVIEETNLITLQVTSENPRRSYQVIQFPTPCSGLCRNHRFLMHRPMSGTAPASRSLRLWQGQQDPADSLSSFPSCALP